MISRAESMPYVDAISSFLLESNDNDSGIWLERLSLMSYVVNDTVCFNEFYRSPMVSDDQVFNLLTGLPFTDESKPTKEFNNFIRLIIKNKRLNLLNSIHFLLVDRYSAESMYEIDTPYILTGKELKKIDLGDGSVIKKQRIDRRLITGIKIRTGSRVYDASTQDKLNYFKLHIMNRE